MSQSHRPGKWSKHLRLLSLLPLPDRLLKYFPPSFVFRDPVHSLVHKARASGTQVAVVLFHLEDYHSLLKSNPPAFTAKLQKQLIAVFQSLIKEYVMENDIIGIKQFHSDDIVLFVKVADNEAFGRCSILAGQMKTELELRLSRMMSLHVDQVLSFQTGSSMLEDYPDTEAAIEMSYYYAMARAAKNLPPHFALHYMQLENIISTEDITVLTQPIMNLSTGEIYGWEVLTRGPKNTPFHNPTELFEFAFQAELLPELEWLVIQKATKEIADRGIKEQVFINITPVSLTDPLLLNRMIDQFKMYAIPTTQIVFEITERHSIDDFEQMAGIVRSYRAQGFRFAVDDAGAGYSSLQSISELIPDIIKIDKSVIRNIDRESVKQAVLRSLLYFAENINCQVIAEGVEREEEANILLLNQVHMGQGYYFAKPEPFEQGRNPGHFANLKEKIIQMRRQAGRAVG